MTTVQPNSEMPIAVHPDRPKLRKRPLKALHHFRELLKDKEDTKQVFWIFEALPRKSFATMPFGSGQASGAGPSMQASRICPIFSTIMSGSVGCPKEA